MSLRSSRSFKTTLGVDIGLSTLLRGLLIICYSLTGILCLVLSLDLLVRIGLCLLSIAYGLYLILYQFGPLNESRVRRIIYTNNQGWCLLFASGGQVTTHLHLPVFVTRFLVIARFGGGIIPQYCVVIPADAVERTVFRHLRVRLLQSAHGNRNRR